MSSSREIFFSKLDKFITKHSLYIFVRGFTLFLLLFFIVSFVFSIAEILFSFGENIRFFLFLFLIISTSLSFLVFVFIPFLAFIKVIPSISYSKACNIIQENFSESKDFLTNIFELSIKPYTELIEASIDQKFSYIKDIDFIKCLTSRFRKVFKIQAILFFLFIVCFLYPFSFYSNGLSHIVNYTESYCDNNFSIVIDESKLIVEQGLDLEINAVVKCDYNFDELFISIQNRKFLMNKVNDSLFTYTFKSVNSSFNFKIISGSIESKNYKVDVIIPPVVYNYSIDVVYPNYLNKDDTVINNENILIVPCGTILKFNFFSTNVDSIFIISDSDSSLNYISIDDGAFYKKQFFSNYSFSVKLANSQITKDFLDFKVTIIPDLFPIVDVSTVNENISPYFAAFDCLLKDDYGFSKFQLIVSDDSVSTDTFFIPINKNITSQQIFYTFPIESKPDINSRNIYFTFELFDNDGINGFKKSVSKIFTHSIKSIAEQNAQKEKQYLEIFKNLELGSKLSNEIKTDIENMRKRMLDNKLSQWEKDNLINQISEKTHQLENMLSDINQFYNQLSQQQSNELLEKQKLIAEMMQNLIDEELQRILDEIQKLAKNSEQYNKTAENLKTDFNEFEKSIDKNLELLKKIKIEEQLQTVVDNINTLIEQQNTISYSDLNDSLAAKVESHNKFLENIKQQYNTAIEENKMLEKPLNINNYNSSFESIINELNNQKQSIENNSFNDFNKSNKEAIDLLNKLSSEISNDLGNQKAIENAENADDLRQILDNLFHLSFTQEDIISLNNQVYSNDNFNYDRIGLLSEVVNKFKIVRDSLYSLSKRTVYLGNFVSNSAFLIEDNLIKAMQMYQEQRTYNANVAQRDAFKHTNNLILLLAESLKNIENSQGQGAGESSKRRKKNKENNNPSLSDLRKSQESLKNQMRNILNQMSKGNNEQINQQIVKSLIQNELYQHMLDQIMYGSDIDAQTAKLLQEIKNMMEKNHSDLSNKNISVQTIMRQQNIVTKLLEAENSENERDKDNERKSEKGKNIDRKTPNNLKEEIKFEKNIDFLYQNNIRLNSFFKTKFEEYLNSINSWSNE